MSDNETALSTQENITHSFVNFSDIPGPDFVGNIRIEGGALASSKTTTPPKILTIDGNIIINGKGAVIPKGTVITGNVTLTGTVKVEQNVTINGNVDATNATVGWSRGLVITGEARVAKNGNIPHDSKIGTRICGGKVVTANHKKEFIIPPSERDNNTSYALAPNRSNPNR